MVRKSVSSSAQAAAQAAAAALDVVDTTSHTMNSSIYRRRHHRSDNANRHQTSDLHDDNSTVYSDPSQSSTGSNRIAFSDMDKALNTPPPSRERRAMVDPNNTIPDDGGSVIHGDSTRLLTRSDIDGSSHVDDAYAENKENRFLVLSPLQHAKQRRSADPPPKFAVSSLASDNTTTSTTNNSANNNISSPHEWHNQNVTNTSDQRKLRLSSSRQYSAPSLSPVSSFTSNDHSATKSSTAGSSFHVRDLPAITDDGTKPPFSYAMLIGLAILNSPERRLTLAQIYGWIKETFTWYRTNNTGWQNSIRHNLSLNKSFAKKIKPKSEPGKGNYWTVVPGHEKQFLKTSKRKGLGSSAVIASRAHSNLETVYRALETSPDTARTSGMGCSTSISTSSIFVKSDNSSDKQQLSGSVVMSRQDQSAQDANGYAMTRESSHSQSIPEVGKEGIPAQHLHTLDLAVRPSISPESQPSSLESFSRSTDQGSTSRKRLRPDSSADHMESTPRKKFDLNNTEIPCLSIDQSQTPVKITGSNYPSPSRLVGYPPLFANALGPAIGGLQLQSHHAPLNSSSPAKMFTPSRFLDDSVLHSLTALDDEDMCAFGSPSRGGNSQTPSRKPGSSSAKGVTTSTVTPARRFNTDSAVGLWPFDELSFLSSSPQRP